MRVVVFNAQGLRAGVAAAAAALGRLAPDLALIQECGPARRLRGLAGELGMQEVSSHRPFGRVRNAVLHGTEWRRVEAHPLALSRTGRSSPRGAMAVTLRRSGVVVVAVSAHLGLSPAERVRHARELTDAFAGSHHPLLLGADMNEGPDGPAFRWVAERLFDTYVLAGDGPAETFPSVGPAHRIDVLFANDRVRILSARAAHGKELARASDHMPVVVEVELLTE